VAQAPSPLRQASLAFCAGALAALLFQQGTLALLRGLDVSGAAPWSLHAVPRLGLPELLVALIVGGGGAMVLGHLLRGLRGGMAYWLTWIVAGALALSLAVWLVVFPVEGRPLGGGWIPAAVVVTLVANAAWGVGTALFLRVFGVQRPG
jgi:hypothetical protein